MPSSTSHRASFATRSTLSATVPSFSWNTILELGELADHSGDEVRFSEARGPFGLVRQLLPLPVGERVGVRGFGARR